MMMELDLAALMLPRRFDRLQQVVQGRTRQLTVAMEMVDKGHNQSAIMRTCDAYGVQEVHIVEREGIKFRPSRMVTQGVHKWLDIHRHASTPEAIAHLRAKGYMVWASSLQPGATLLPDLDLTGRIALLFGNEIEGLEEESLALCDGAFVIPMVGFSQSLNVSVAAAITLFEAYRQRLQRFGQMGDLSESEREELMESYLARATDKRVLKAAQGRK